MKAATTQSAGAALHPLRRRLRWLTPAADIGLAFVSYEAAFIFFRWFHDAGITQFTHSFDWGLALGVFAIACLYKFEVFVSRPLHVLVLFRGVLIALVVTAFFTFTFKAPLVTDSRLTLFTAFGAFFVLTVVVRTAVLDRLYRADVQNYPGGTMVIGESSDSSVIVSRCKELRGYAPVTSLQPLDKRRNGYDAEPALVHELADAEPAPRQVFLDGASLGHKATFDLITAARARGADVYITGRLVSPLDTTKLLIHLFEMPVMRVRRDPLISKPVPAAKRIFDIVASAAALVVLAPALAVIALLIKRGSPGPVFYRQERVGLRGQTFEFLKFRSMTVGNDAGAHQDYVCELIANGGNGVEAMNCTDEWGRPVFKLADDDRVTRVGRFLRKYSLDELPQFWNVLKGEMSMVGPRPALGYEVEAYKPWHRRRLEVQPGVSGLWQVAGRSRVGFDEMVFQDVIYSYNQSVLTDVSLCLRTVPAVLMGRGAV
jgi:exopolysaccharide biosynthesis polyprenyl glycosylphosphotransferase